MAKREGWSHQERERLLEGRSRPHKQTNALRVCVWLIKAPERVLLTTQLRLRDAPSATCSHRTSSVPDTGQPRPPRHHRLFSTRQVDASHLHNPASRNSAWAVCCMQAGTGALVEEAGRAFAVQSPSRVQLFTTLEDRSTPGFPVPSLSPGVSPNTTPDSLGKTLMLGKIAGGRRRGRQRMRRLDGIADSVDVKLGKLGQTVGWSHKDRN